MSFPLTGTVLHLLARRFMPAAPPKYKAPPVIERVVSVYAKMDHDVYDRQFETWREMVIKDFPIDEPVKRWKVEIKKTGGIPSDFLPELEIEPRFSKKPGGKGFDWSIRCPEGHLTMNMHSWPGLNRTYADLRECFPVWLAKWQEHFAVEKFKELCVHYVNALNPSTLPSFYEGKSLEVQKVLKIFFNMSCENESFTPPLDCQMTIKLHDSPGGFLRIHAKDDSSEAMAALQLDLLMSTELDTGKSIEDILFLMDWCHDRIVERFELIFTDEAKTSFQPL